ncbi:MAG: methionine synthase [Acutalibacteraceae bacterium]|nr:methionine synthase [Acutalibacteraceae bacterium]
MITLENLNYNEALRYMGCRSDKADNHTMDMLAECEKLVIENSVPRYRYAVYDINETAQGIEVLGTNILLTGEDIKRHLHGCYGIVLMCATISGKIDILIRKTQLEDMSKAIVVNSLSSVAIEQVCDKAEKEIYNQLGECYKTWRYSPGYGDLPINLQKDILTTLDAPRKIGLCTSESMTLTPIKSVTAIIGLSHNPVSPAKRGCLSCNLKDTCQYRKVGNHCVQ